jgi:hypothetical protein
MHQYVFSTISYPMPIILNKRSAAIAKPVYVRELLITTSPLLHVTLLARLPHWPSRERPRGLGTIDTVRNDQG